MSAARAPCPTLMTNVVIFTIRARRLQLLLVRRAAPPFAGRWALPGGHVDMNEDLDAAARRQLREETGVSGVYLEQLYTFGAVHRDPRERVVSVAYYALIPSDRLHLQAGTDAEAVAWFACDALPQLAFDHREIVTTAQRRLAAKLDYSTIAFQFMAEEFTLRELQEVFEIIHGTPLDKRNFRKSVLALDCLEDTGRTRSGGAHRPARLYRLKQRDRVEIIK